MAVKFESDLRGAEKLAFGGLCDAVGQFIALFFDEQPAATQRKISRHIAKGTGRIRVDVLTDPLRVEVLLEIDDSDQVLALYEVRGTPDGMAHELAPRGGRPILPIGLQKRYREQL